jgi:hypothetical protein
MQSDARPIHPDPREIQKSPIRFRPHECFRCCGAFKLGDMFHSDAPGIVYHLRCYIAEVKQVRSTSNPSQE